MRTIKIGILQQHNVADRTDNMMRLAKGIEDLAKRGAELIVLQELHNSLYFCQVEDVNNFDLAEPIPGPSTGFYGELARQFGVVIVTSLFEKRAAGLYHNTAVVIEKDGSVSNVKVLRGIGSGCDEEAVRVIKSMPKWKPGMMKGEPVPVSYQIPINFKLSEKQPKKK